jgi:hypothetical protein
MARSTHRTARLRATTTLAVVLTVTGGVLAACSGDDEATTTTTEATTTTLDPAVAELATTFRADVGADTISADEATCVARTLVDELGAEEAAEVVGSSDDLLEIPATQRVVVTDTFNDCVPGTAVATAVVEEFYTSIGASSEPDPVVVDCVATEMDGRTGDVLFEGAEADSNDTLPTVTLAALESCVPDDVLAEVFVSAFEAEGATPEQAQCTAEAVTSQLTLEQITRLGLDDAEMSPEIEGIITQAATGCL